MLLPLLVREDKERFLDLDVAYSAMALKHLCFRFPKSSIWDIVLIPSAFLFNT